MLTKQTLKLIVILIFINLTSNAQVNLRNGLVAYYPFDGDALDHSGNNKHLNISGAILSTDTFNSPLSAYAFNGSSSSMISSGPVNFGTNSFTISAWLKTSQVGTAYFLTGGTTFRSWMSDGATGGITMISGATQTASGNGATPNAWTHYLATFNGTTLNIYLNGVLKGTAGYNLANLGSMTLQLGKLGSNYYNGKLDEMAFYNRVVNASEINALYNRNIIMPVDIKTDLIAYYPFNANAYDYSGNGNHLSQMSCSPVADVNGTPHSAYSLNGSTSKIFGNSLSVNSNKVSISCWIKSKQLGQVWFLAGGNFNLYTKDSSLAGMSVSTPSTNSAATAANLTGWTHLVGVYDSLNIKIYINGVLRNSVYHPGAGFGAFPLVIGEFNNIYWAGAIDDLAIYKRALSSKDIEKLYEKIAPVKTIVTDFNASDTLICTGDFVDFYNTSSGIYLSSEWSFPGSNIQPVFSDTAKGIVFNTPGTYAVKLKASNELHSDSTIKINYIHVVGHPSPKIVSTTGKFNFCKGDSLILSADSKYSLYQWRVNNTYINGSVSMAITTKDSGNYELEVSDSNGCKNISPSQFVEMNVVETPIITTNPANKTMMCPNDSVEMKSSLSKGNRWFKNGSSIVGDSLEILIVSDSGSYQVQVSDSGCFSDFSAPVDIGLFAKPETGKIKGDTLVLNGSLISYYINKSVPTKSFWSVLGGTILSSTADSVFITWNKIGKGFISFVEESQNGCVSDTAFLNIEIATSLNTRDIGNEIQQRTVVYPNPSDGKFTIQAETPVSGFEVWDVTGAMLHYSEVQHSKSIDIDLSHLNQGVYYIRLYLNNNIVISKLIIK